MKATVIFNGDSSVGDRPYSYEMEIPDFEYGCGLAYRDEVRKLIQELYKELDGEYIPHVIFEDETE